MITNTFSEVLLHNAYLLRYQEHLLLDFAFLLLQTLLSCLPPKAIHFPTRGKSDHQVSFVETFTPNLNLNWLRNYYIATFFL